MTIAHSWPAMELITCAADAQCVGFANDSKDPGNAHKYKHV
jgi:hypothetical protein